MTEETVKRRKQRSPNYPGLSLEKALERAEQLYHQERRHAAPIPTILSHWGYSPKSSPGLVAIATLKKFGLIQDEGSAAARVARLTDLALSIIEDPRSESTEKEQAIKEAALLPRIHRELWDKYGGDLPSDPTVEYYLVRERDFTQEGARHFLRLFRRTITFANLDDSATVVVDEGENGEDNPPPPPPPGGDVTPGQAVQLPLGGAGWATLQAAFPLSEAAWAQMMRVLEVMKPGLVAEKSPDEEYEGNQE